jgi:hypothetical protein
VAIPEILELLFWIKQRFCGRSRKSGKGVMDQKEILTTFQKIIWNRSFGSTQKPKSVLVNPKVCAYSRNSGIFVSDDTEIL